MKKLVAMFIVMAIMLSTSILAFAETKYKGDINGDGNVSAVDARVILRYAAGLETLNEEDLKHDLSGDGRITAVDARIVLRMAAGLENKIPFEEEKEDLTLVQKEDIIRKEFHKLVNEERVRCGVAPLETNTTLQAAADVRADECHVSFSHTRPDGTDCFSIFEGEFTYNAWTLGENIAYIGQGCYEAEELNDVLSEAYLKDLARQFFTNYKNSPGHYANMINKNFKETGVGISINYDSQDGWIRVYCTQFFGSQM